MEALPPDVNKGSQVQCSRRSEDNDKCLLSELLIAGKLQCKCSPGEVIDLLTCDQTGNEDRLSVAVAILHFTEHRVPTMSVIV